MPDGGPGNCGNCRHLSDGQHCRVRDVSIEVPYWTTCHNLNSANTDPEGPIYAIVGIVGDGGVGYQRIPYLNGNRPDTSQIGEGGDTVIRVRDSEGQSHTFETTDEYLRFREQRLGRDSR